MPTANITVGLILLFVMIGYYLSINVFYGEFAAEQTTLTQGYFILLAIVLASFAIGLPAMRLNLLTLTFFSAMFIATYFLLTAFSFLKGAFPSGAVAINPGITLIGMFIFAFIEETIWADIIKPRVGRLWSIATFGIFHTAAIIAILGARGMPITFFGVLPAIVLLGLLRVMWDLIDDRFEVTGSTGSHFAWNVFLSGIKII